LRGRGLEGIGYSPYRAETLGEGGKGVVSKKRDKGREVTKYCTRKKWKKIQKGERDMFLTEVHEGWAEKELAAIHAIKVMGRMN